MCGLLCCAHCAYFDNGIVSRPTYSQRLLLWLQQCRYGALQQAESCHPELFNVQFEPNRKDSESHRDVVILGAHMDLDGGVNLVGLRHKLAL